MDDLRAAEVTLTCPPDQLVSIILATYGKSDFLTFLLTFIALAPRILSSRLEHSLPLRQF
jgi:hypothetical protein